MNNLGEAACVLIVDDRPDKLLAIEAALIGLKVNVVKVGSGREALRRLLNEDFAVILLDVNMPGMDGFETARLIRQRRRSEHIPIIFITAFGDDLHMAEGYSLGAVDYILTPIVPEVLRTKVAVFLDLYRKTEEIRRQARSLEQQAESLKRLNEASLAIHSALAVERMLEIAAETARDLTGCDHAVIILDEGSIGKQVRAATAINNHDGAPSAGDGKAPAKQSLTLPLLSRERRRMGTLEVSRSHELSFTSDDHALLWQLAQITSVGVENTLFAEAREVNRVKEEFLATLSHELRTPLTAILGWTQLLRCAPLDSVEAGQGLDVIERSVGAQTRLIEDLLDVSRIATGKLRMSMQPSHLRGIVENAVDAIRPIADGRDIELAISLPDDDCVLLGDPDRLHQVATNLLSNAIKFTPPQGRVFVALRPVEGDYELEVADNGIGIHPSFMPHIFDRFRQADSSTRRTHSGLGIGLALVRHVVQLHGGDVTAYSRGEGMGATFTVRLPSRPIDPAAAQVNQGQARTNDADASPVQLAGVRVLLVEDENDTRDLIARALTAFGAQVHPTSNVADALDYLMRTRPDAILSDIAMPEMDGYDLMRSIRALFHDELDNVPAIALTAFAREEDVRAALAAGFFAHVAKPIEPRHLINTIASAIAQRRDWPGGSGYYASPQSRTPESNENAAGN